MVENPKEERERSKSIQGVQPVGVFHVQWSLIVILKMRLRAYGVFSIARGRG
jgi:hypothetical protein